MRENLEEKNDYVKMENCGLYFKRDISFLNCLFFTIKASFTISFYKKSTSKQQKISN